MLPRESDSLHIKLQRERGVHMHYILDTTRVVWCWYWCMHGLFIGFWIRHGRFGRVGWDWAWDGTGLAYIDRLRYHKPLIQ